MATIIEKASEHIEKLYAESTNEKLLFHNQSYKRTTVEKAEELIDKTDLNKKEKEAVLLAAWFMHTGYLISYENASEESKKLANSFLTDEKYKEKDIELVLHLMEVATKDEVPETLAEKAICDINNHFLADKDYEPKSELLKEEIRACSNNQPSDKKWRKQAIKNLRNYHEYYTAYARENWQSQKEKNLKKLLKNKKKAKKLERKEALKAKFKNQIPDRGIQTLYRVTLRNHIKLSDIADTKANILLSVNAIIISLSLANLVPKLDNPSNDYLIYPTFIFIIFCIASMIMSVLATRPNVTSGEFTREDVESKKVNLLFFGNFHKMKLDSYEWAMMKLIEDRDYIYKSLTKDLYYLGVVLERKYRLLRWTYTVFMIGMILSVIAFGVALKFYGPERVLEVPELPS